MVIKKGNEFECSAVTRGIEIELTNYCGMSCIVCPREQLQNFGFMSFDIFKKIVNLLKEGNYEEIMICGLGDAFLHKELFKYINYLFKELPNINLFFMTKGQAINDNHINKLLDLKHKGFNVSLTFSVFSLDKKIYNYLTGGNFYDLFIDTLNKCNKMNINYSLEFMLSILTLNEVDKFKKFAKSLGKDYGMSLVHNWGGSIKNNIHSKLFDSSILKGFYTKREIGDICEVMKYDYLFINYSGNIYQCSLNYSNNRGFIGIIGQNSLSYYLNLKNKLDYNKLCSNCFYFNYKTFT